MPFQRRRPGRHQGGQNQIGQSGGHERAPHHDEPEDPFWTREDSPGRGRRFRVLVSILAAAVVVAALGTYGMTRLHHGSSVSALQDAVTSGCPAASGSSATRTAGCDSGAAGSPYALSGQLTRPSDSRSSGQASAGKNRPSHRRKHRPRPGPTTRTHTPAPSASPTPTPSATLAPAPTSSAPSGTSSSSAADQVLALINQARAQAGLPAYTILSGLDESSRKHTQVMAGGCGLSHQCPGEASLGDRLTAAGVQWTSAGENIGEGGPEPDTSADIAKMAVGLTQSMLDEKAPNDGHRLNILSPSFHHTGIYVFRDSNGTVWMTQDFSS